MAITEYNMHGYREDKKSNMFQIQVPQYYEMVRNIRKNKSTIRDSVKEK